MSDIKIKIAKRHGEFVTPDTPQLDSGSKCGCVCIGCDKPLVLKRGKIRQSHFSHPPRTACTIHDIVKGWIAQALPGQILTLPEHPGLIAPRRFVVCHRDGVQVEFPGKNRGKKRRYDVRIEVMPIMDFKRAYVPHYGYKLVLERFEKYYEPFRGGDVEHDWLLTAYLMEKNKIGSHLRAEWKRDYPDESDVPMLYKTIKTLSQCMSGLNERDFQEARFRPQILPEFYAGRKEASKKMDPKLKDRLKERTPSAESLDHIIVEVRDTNAKDDAFKKQVQDEKRYVLEVDANKFYGDGQGLTIEKLCECSEWVWPAPAEEHLPFKEPLSCLHSFSS